MLNLWEIESFLCDVSNDMMEIRNKAKTCTQIEQSTMHIVSTLKNLQFARFEWVNKLLEVHRDSFHLMLLGILTFLVILCFDCAIPHSPNNIFCSFITALFELYCGNSRRMAPKIHLDYITAIMYMAASTWFNFPKVKPQSTMPFSKNYGR